MGSGIADEVLQELHREHDKLGAVAGDQLYANLARALEMLPEHDSAWAIAKKRPVVLARSRDTLFQIVLHPDENRVTISSRPLNCEKILVGLEWSEPEPGPLPNAAEREQANSTEAWRETKWTFRHIDQSGEELGEWQQLTGRIQITSEGELPDRREHFARTLAARAGWDRRKSPRTKRP